MKLAITILLFVGATALAAPPEEERLSKQQRLEFVEALEASIERDIAEDDSLSEKEIAEMREWIAYLRERETWPHSLDEAVAEILQTLPLPDREIIVKTSRDQLGTFNRSWGMGIRNAFGLWKGNPDLTESVCGEDCEPETVSLRIMEAVWDELTENQDRDASQ